MLKKYAKLYLNIIARHNSYNSKTYQTERLAHKRVCDGALGTLEALRKSILTRHDAAYRELKLAEAKSRASARVAVTPAASSTSVSSATTKHKPKTVAHAEKLKDRYALLRSSSRPELTTAPASKTPTAYSGILKKSVTSHSPHLRAPAAQIPQKIPKSAVHRPPAASGGMRHVLLPSNLMDTFMTKYARDNTARNVETCGVLCGRLENNVFRVSACLIPPQSGTANTTVTSGEEKMMRLQLEKNLITLGWIHTHPSQACFLSSVDLHTQFSYQVMLNEAVAIVMAPTDPRAKHGTFSLTSRGMKVIASCKKRGFHQHADPNSLYHRADHASFTREFNAVFYDLR